MARYVRQAVVVVHGMGEQHPLDTLTRFIDTAIADVGGERVYYSRPESVTGSFESRRFLAPRRLDDDDEEVHAQTEFFEYHWAHLMQGNRLDDLWPTVRRFLLLRGSRVPFGLVPLWLLSWTLIVVAMWLFTWGPWSGLLVGDGDVLQRVIAAVVSGGATATVLSYLLSRALPGWLTTSFVDVVRYLDTSPRSYAVRADIRRGFVELLQALHAQGRPGRPHYDRIVIVAHSLGAFIAYDGISHLWGSMNHQHAGSRAPEELDGLRELEQAASALPDPGVTADAAALDAYRAAQRRLWRGLRAQGNGWLITDLVTVGTPMYFADRLIAGRGARSFRARIDRRELPTCPPQDEERATNNINGTRRFYSWPKTVYEGRRVVRRRVLYEGAPFAVVRWTNLYFPARGHLFGDWFGGPVAPLFGSGIRDVVVTGNTPGAPGASWSRNRLLPAYAHALYFSFPDDDDPAGAASRIREAMDLASTRWAGMPPPIDDGEQEAGTSGRDPVAVDA